jgi:hypothetical protein
MRVNLLVTAVCALVCVTSGCGQSEGEKRAGEMKVAAEQVASSAGAPTQPVEPVSFRDMQATFGDLAGWEKGTPTGERMTAPVSFSRAEVDYRNGDSRIRIKISDSAFNQMLVMPYAMFLTAGYESQTEDGYERSIKVGDHPGWEKWNTQDKSGELNAIVAKRFIVQIEGADVGDVKALHAAMATIDLAKLAALK